MVGREYRHLKIDSSRTDKGTINTFIPRVSSSLLNDLSVTHGPLHLVLLAAPPIPSALHELIFSPAFSTSNNLRPAELWDDGRRIQERTQMGEKYSWLVIIYFSFSSSLLHASWFYCLWECTRSVQYLIDKEFRRDHGDRVRLVPAYGTLRLYVLRFWVKAGQQFRKEG